MNNYNNYSKKNSEHKQKPARPEPVVEPEVKVVDDIPETCIHVQANAVPTEPEIIETPKEIFGVVDGCAKLNIREEPSIDGEIVAVVASGAVLEIDSGNCDDEWFGVCTATGVQGFCMAKYVTIKD